MTSTTPSGITRRKLLCAALPPLVSGPLAVGPLALSPLISRAADTRIPIADMHSHFGIITRPALPSADFAEELRAQYRLGYTPDQAAAAIQAVREVQGGAVVLNGERNSGRRAW